MSLPKWVRCELCDWNDPKLNGELCGGCALKDKDSFFYKFKNDKIENEIHNIYMENKTEEMDNDVIVDKLIKRGLL